MSTHEKIQKDLQDNSKVHNSLKNAHNKYSCGFTLQYQGKFLSHLVELGLNR
jgi:hypothetical protein